jgi:5-oxoprolinase (ATP-hydrolysing)
VYHPYGLAGGEDGSCGLNIWVRKVNGDGGKENGEHERRINLGGKNTAAMKAGERIIICTPGGGGWGKAEERSSARKEAGKDPRHGWRGGSHASREEMALQA